MIRARIGERFSGKLTMQKSRFPAQRSSVTVAVRTQFGRNTNQKGFEHPAALPAPQVELRNHLLHGPARVVHQGRNHRGMESSAPEKMHQQIAGVDEFGVLGLGQDSLSGYFRSNISDLHILLIFITFVLSLTKKSGARTPQRLVMPLSWCCGTFIVRGS